MIMDEFSTSILISLTMNVPTILYFDIDQYIFKEKYRRILQDMKNVGIIFDDYKSAAVFINNINSIEDWWASSKVQNVRNNFINEFCHIDNNWLTIFVNNLNQIINRK